MNSLSKEILFYIIGGLLVILLIFSFYSNIKNSIKIKELQKQNRQIIADFVKNSQDMNQRLQELNIQIDKKINNNSNVIKSLQSNISDLYKKLGDIPVNQYQTEQQINSGLNYYYNQWKMIEN